VTVTKQWLDPATPGLLSLAAGQLLSEQVWDRLLGVLLWVGGTTGTNAVAVKRTVQLSVANFTHTPIPFDSEIYDSNGMHSTVTNTTRLTVVESGNYIIAGNVYWDGLTTGTNDLWLRLNGASALEAQMQMSTAATSYGHGLSTMRLMGAGEYVELMVFQDSGAAKLLAALSQFGMARIGGN
jgi:hypothetical protein